MEEGIHSISLNPEVVVKTTLQLLELERASEPAAAEEEMAAV